jgi:4-diphosphocytidyl-2C-methyl-D-erythritol kinase
MTVMILEKLFVVELKHARRLWMMAWRVGSDVPARLGLKAAA